MDLGIVLSLVGIFILICGSAFFSSSETALMGSSLPKLHSLEDAGDPRATRVRQLLERPDTLLSTILLGNNVVNIGASAIATGVFIKLFGEIGVVYATALMTLLVLIFAEVLPKTAASRIPERFAMAISLPVQTLIYLLRPATWLIGSICRVLLQRLGLGDDQTEPTFSTHDLRGAIGLGKAHGVLERGDHRMLDSILDLHDLTVEELMTHRSQIASLNIALSPEALADKLVQLPYSRIPMWADNSDNIVGILHAKDFFHAWHHARTHGAALHLPTILQEAYFIPDVTSVKKQLLEFRRRRRHLALVVDEYGDLQGLITLEDILEEIVGEIEDEHDISNGEIHRRPDGAVVLPGDFTVRDANREFDWDLPEGEDAVTLGGLMIETLGHIPAVGETVTLAGIELKVLSKKRQAVGKVQLTPPPSALPPVAAAS